MLKNCLLILACAWGGIASAADTLVIISPHRKSIQREFLPKFKEYYKKQYNSDVNIEWLDQGGTSDDVRFVRAKFKKNPKTSGIDIFWGGGSSTFLELNMEGILEKHPLSKVLASEIPSHAAGVPLRDESQTWHAAAMSSFGIFYNKRLMKFEKLEEPKTWDDLASPKYEGLVSLTDPRRSGTYYLMNRIVLESKGWDKGWQLLTEIAGNVPRFTHSSSDPIKAVVSGDAAASMAIDFYSAAKIADLGKDNLGFVIPEGQTVLDPDPIAILKGAPNHKVAARFVDFVLNSEMQKLWVLPRGVKNGPRFAVLGRMAVNTKTYKETTGQRIAEVDPFSLKGFLKLDTSKTARTSRVFRDLIGAIMVDTHHELREAWKAIQKSGAQPADLAAFGKVPVSEKELEAEALKWDDEVYRNKKINEWVQFARNKFNNVKKNALSH